MPATPLQFENHLAMDPLIPILLREQQHPENKYI
jgi:hypothetical protein